MKALYICRSSQCRQSQRWSHRWSNFMQVNSVPDK